MPRFTLTWPRINFKLGDYEEIHHDFMLLADGADG